MKTMLFGPIGNMQAVPYPEQGMAWDHNRDTEVTELLSGGRHVYEAPTPYKSFSLSYKGGTQGLQPLIDLRTGVYGPGPFYLIDFNFTAGNVLPTRWASAYMLKHIADGWCAPEVIESTTALAGRASVFTNYGQFPTLGESLILPVIPGKGYWLRAWGDRTGSAVLRVSARHSATGAWSVIGNYVPTTGGTQELQVVGASSVYHAVKLEIVCPANSTITFDHINLLTEAGTAIRKPGLGVGAVKFSSGISGNIVSKRFDRIGLSLDLTETE